MKLLLATALIFCVSAPGKDKKLPSGDASNEAVGVAATYYDVEQLKETFGTDFGNMFQVIEVTLTPRGDKPLDVHLDDFLMRSEQSGEHSGPLAPSQIAGQNSLVLHPTEQKGKTGIGFGGGIGPIMMGGGTGGTPTVPTTRVETKHSDNRDPLLDVLKRKILAEKPISEPVTGLLFFPLDKEKVKNLVLIYTTPPGKLRIKFK